MPCSCRDKKNRAVFVWTPPEGSGLQPRQYAYEIQAKAKVTKYGGTYAKVSP